jgi:erythromycin esterase
MYCLASQSIRSSLALAIIAVAAACGASDGAPTDPTNLSFTGTPGIPDGWSGAAGSHVVGLTTSQKHGGSSALYVTGPGITVAIATATPAILTQTFRADDYRGKRVRFSAWAKPLDVRDVNYSGLWLRVDGPGMTLSFDNMFSRPVTGSGDWREISIVLDVPQNSLGIAGGVLFNGRNTLLLDDMKLEVVPTTVAATAPVSPGSLQSDSATYATAYARARPSPVNLDFEGLPGPSAETVAWLTQNTSLLTTTDPRLPVTDLEPLRQMIGTSRIVGLGEGTHGTREFFQMKHRILRYLVANMGFTHFAIEATSPESDDMNRYVLNGEGDPERWLSRLYFWTWNTQEVLDMVRWMREWNMTAPANQRVQFVGFDMQAPGASIDSVASFLSAVDRTLHLEMVEKYACITPYRNSGQTSGLNPTLYGAQGDNIKASCAAGLQLIYDKMKAKQADLEAATSAARFAAAHHHARLVQQFESMVAPANTTAGSRARDAAMAENVVWLRDQAGPNAKLVLWAHNGHVNTVTGWMGGHLRQRYGNDYLSLGFAFGRGAFTAYGQSGTTTTTLNSWTVSIIPKSSIEAAFEATGRSMLLFDARKVVGVPAAAAIAGPITMRSIGAVFNQQSESAYFGMNRFPNDYDMLIYLSQATASTRLPFKY